jgi:hypothetical protein
VSDEPIEIENIVIEPKATSQQFVLYGTKDEKGVIIGLDFSSLHEPSCRNPDSPGTSGSDYELWTPNDGRATDKCLMGRTMSYVRRKQESECYNGVEFERSIFATNCECKESDYECDLNFYRDSKTSHCVPVEESARVED